MVNGFLDEVVREVPMEYAVEMNRLVGLEMEGQLVKIYGKERISIDKPGNLTTS